MLPSDIKTQKREQNRLFTNTSASILNHAKILNKMLRCQITERYQVRSSRPTKQEI